MNKDFIKDLTESLTSKNLQSLSAHHFVATYDKVYGSQIIQTPPINNQEGVYFYGRVLVYVDYRSTSTGVILTYFRTCFKTPQGEFNLDTHSSGVDMGTWQETVQETPSIINYDAQMLFSTLTFEQRKINIGTYLDESNLSGNILVRARVMFNGYKAILM